MTESFIVVGTRFHSCTIARAIEVMHVWIKSGCEPHYVCLSNVYDVRLAQRRADDMLTTEDGTLISSVFIRHFMGVSLNRQLIREWQLEQTGRHEFILRYIPLGILGLEENLRRIKESFQKALGDRASIQMQQVNSISLV